MPKYIRFRYDGEDLEDHSINIDDFAPALLALNKLCKAANSKVNGVGVKSEVRINVEIDQNCFEIQFLLDLIVVSKELFERNPIVTSDQLLTWLGIIGSETVGAAGLIEIIKFFNGKPASEGVVQTINSENGPVVQLHIKGDNNTITIHPESFDMYKEPTITRAAQALLKPLEKEGFNSLEFEEDNGRKEKITSSEAKPFIEANIPNNKQISPDVEPPRTIQTHLRVYAPVFDAKAPKWRFELGKDHIYADITETTIAQDAVARGKSSVDDLYEVDLEITQHKTSQNEFRNEYKILKVSNFFPAREQEDMYYLEKDDPKRVSITYNKKKDKAEE